VNVQHRIMQPRICVLADRRRRLHDAPGCRHAVHPGTRCAGRCHQPWQVGRCRSAWRYPGV